MMIKKKKKIMKRRNGTRLSGTNDEKRCQCEINVRWQPTMKSVRFFSFAALPFFIYILYINMYAQCDAVNAGKHIQTLKMTISSYRWPSNVIAAKYSFVKCRENSIKKKRQKNSLRWIIFCAFFLSCVINWWTENDSQKKIDVCGFDRRADDYLCDKK